MTYTAHPRSLKPPTPAFLLVSPCRLQVNMKGPTAVATHAAGGCREEKTCTEREVEREAEIEGRGIDFHLQQLQFKASLQFRGSAGPGMSPSRARLPVCGQDFPCGPRDSQAAPKENNYSDRREMCTRSQTCCIGKRESGRGLFRPLLFH